MMGLQVEAAEGRHSAIGVVRRDFRPDLPCVLVGIQPVFDARRFSCVALEWLVGSPFIPFLYKLLTMTTATYVFFLSSAACVPNNH
ncbi:hypothetical protein, partial [Salmonella enterica]|uniref:hypothetical protein n=1 Tax=Salmonella enterica TaxID=28901 RepID=UPI00398C537C